MASVALVRESDNTVISTHRTAPGRMDLPGVGQVSPAVIGWKGNGYKIVQFNPADPPPSGKRRVGQPILTVGANSVQESYQLEDEPPSGPPDEISDRQFIHGLWRSGTEGITYDQARAFVKTGEVPPQLQALIDAIPNEESRKDAQLLVEGSTTFNRTHPFTSAIAQGYGWTQEQVDDFWRFCAGL